MAARERVADEQYYVSNIPTLCTRYADTRAREGVPLLLCPDDARRGAQRGSQLPGEQEVSER